MKIIVKNLDEFKAAYNDSHKNAIINAKLLYEMLLRVERLEKIVNDKNIL